MEWNDKRQMAELLNNGQYQEAVDMLQNDMNWDDLTMEIFICGFDLSQWQLCCAIKDRLCSFNAVLHWREAVRLEILIDLLKKHHDT